MKLKYYLRGLGTGILFATIVLFISYSYKMSDSQIKKEAEKLGMVYAGSTEESTGIFGDETTGGQAEPGSESSQATSSSEESSATQPSTETGSEQDSSTEKPANETTTEPTTTEPPTTTLANVAKCELTVNSRTTSHDVAYALHAAGIVDDAEALDNFLCNNGYATKIQNGTYTITSDMSFEDIAKIITTRKN
ncbi:MAG: hypothetical protein IJF37_01005 [Lachnospiraceae bacterium]|nr:hypothetical protein [Lachnospiraceae bacterium]